MPEQAQDMASMILYLGSAANGHVNGVQIEVTGKNSQPLLSMLLSEYRARGQQSSRRLDAIKQRTRAT